MSTPGLAPYVELLAAQPDADGLRALFTTWITLPQSALDELVPPLLDACVEHVKGRGEFDLECRTILDLGETHPGDAGVLAALLLNRLVLSPGEAIYLPAGNLHAYLHGTAIEIMANSDNVLRGGLTPKHVDVPELLRVLDFRCGDMPVLRGEDTGRIACYRTDAPEFELTRIEWAADDLGPQRLDCTGPQIMICTAGSVGVCADGGAELDLDRGESVWIAAVDPAVTVRPHGDAPAQVFRATPGSAPQGATDI